MLRSRQFSHLSLLATGLLFAQAAGAASVAKPVSESMFLAAGSVVEVECLHGDLTIMQWEKDEVFVSGTLGMGVEQLLFERVAGGVDIEIEHSPGVEVGRGTEWKIRVPREVHLKVGTVSASVQVEVAGGTLDLSSTSGDIAVHGSPDRVEVESIDGKIVIEGARERIQVDAVEGEVHLVNCGGAAVIETASGSIDVRGGKFSSLVGESDSGAIRFRALMSRHVDARFTTESGVVVLAVDPEVRAAFDLESSSGKVVNPLGRGKAGGARFRVHTESGSISVLTESESEPSG